MNFLKKLGLVYSTLFVFLLGVGLLIGSLRQAWIGLHAESWWEKLNAPFAPVIPLFLCAAGYLYFRDYLYSTTAIKNPAPLRAGLIALISLMLLGIFLSKESKVEHYWALGFFWFPSLYVVYRSGMSGFHRKAKQPSMLGGDETHPPSRLDQVAPVIFYTNAICISLAAGWFVTSESQGRWEPAILFLTLAAGMAVQIRARKHSRYEDQPERYSYYVRTAASLLAICIALLSSKPSQEAHVGAIAHAESLHWHEHFAHVAKRDPGGLIGKNPKFSHAMASSFGFEMARAHDYDDYLFFSIAHHKLRSISIGVLGYIVFFSMTKVRSRVELYSSWQGERYLANFVASATVQSESIKSVEGMK